jgi:hypothetical protein
MPQAILSFWTDIPRAHEADFNAWYNGEHLPERTALPGFLTGARYAATRGGPKYLAIYRAASPDTFASRTYLERLDAPTPWTSRIMRRVVNAERQVYRVIAGAGAGHGAALFALRMAMPDDGRALADWLTGNRIPRLIKTPGIARIELWQTDTAASDVDTAERRLRGDAPSPSRWCLVVEGNESGALARAVALHLPAAALNARGAGAMRRGHYRLLRLLTHNEARPG